MYDTGKEIRVSRAAPHLRLRLWGAVAVATLLAAAPTVPVLAQWTTQSPLPTHLEVRGVAAPAPGRVFLATDDDSFDDGGALFESNDGGATWIQRDVPVRPRQRPERDLLPRRPARLGVGQRQLPHHGRRHHLGRAALPGLGLLHGVLHRRASASRPATSAPTSAATAASPGTPSPEGMSAFAFADDLTGLGVAATGLYRTTDGGDTFALVQAGVADAVAFLSPTVAVAIVDGILRALDRRRSHLDGQHGGRGPQPTPRRLRRRGAGLGTKRHLSRLRRPHLPLRRRRRRPGPTSAR